jgi:hypothetical protein
MHHNGAGNWLKPIECIQDNALIMSVFVPSELATCSRPHAHPFEGTLVGAQAFKLAKHFAGFSA